jgi:two-component system sensor histidine kinase DegS
VSSKTEEHTTPATEQPGVLDSAAAIVSEMLGQLKTLVDSAQQRSTRLADDMRQAERALDEVVTQHQFARERNLPSVTKLATREHNLRSHYNAISQEAGEVQRSLKQLDQLVRQIEMSSTTLAGSGEGETSDPWMQALKAQVVLGREEERVRLAREVHDSPAQVIANALIGLEQCRSLLESERMDRLELMLDRLCTATREGLQEVRHLIADLRPGRLEEQGLVGALKDYIHHYCDAYRTEVTFDAGDLPPLSREAEIVLYRIVQESLQNAHKHARGATVHITLGVQHNQLNLSIRDEGPGFDPREVARRAGRESWGLTSMRERAQMVGAQYKVTSRKGHGTEVSVVLSLAS